MPYKQPGSPFAKLRKTTTGKDRHFLKAKEGAGMTAKGRAKNLCSTPQMEMLINK